MNILLLGVNGDIGRAIFDKIYCENFQYFITYSKKKPNFNKKNISLLKIDFSNSKLVDQKIKKFNDICFDLIINNVGDSNPYKDFDKISFDEVKKSFDINFLSAFKIIFKFTKKAILRKKKLHIINISTNTIKFLGSKKNFPYFISKSNMETFLLYLSKHYSKNKIKVNIIRPGLINTKKTTNLKNYSKLNFKKREKLIPSGKAGKPQDVANLIDFLINKNSNYISGQIISVAGGE